MRAHRGTSSPLSGLRGVCPPAAIIRPWRRVATYVAATFFRKVIVSVPSEFLPAKLLRAEAGRYWAGQLSNAVSPFRPSLVHCPAATAVEPLPRIIRDRGAGSPRRRRARSRWSRGCSPASEVFVCYSLRSRVPSISDARGGDSLSHQRHRFGANVVRACPRAGESRQGTGQNEAIVERNRRLGRKPTPNPG